MESQRRTKQRFWAISALLLFRFSDFGRNSCFQDFLKTFICCSFVPRPWNNLFWLNFPQSLKVKWVFFKNLVEFDWKWFLRGSKLLWSKRKSFPPKQVTVESDVMSHSTFCYNVPQLVFWIHNCLSFLLLFFYLSGKRAALFKLFNEFDLSSKFIVSIFKVDKQMSLI